MSKKIIRPLLQEIYRADPWKMLVCCILLNLCKRTTVDRVRKELFEKYPTPEKMANADEDYLIKLFNPLGFQKRRTKLIKKMSGQFVNGFNKVTELAGIGVYANDSWEIFQNNNYDVKPTDKVLKEYLRLEWEK